MALRSSRAVPQVGDALSLVAAYPYQVDPYPLRGDPVYGGPLPPRVKTPTMSMVDPYLQTSTVSTVDPYRRTLQCLG